MLSDLQQQHVGFIIAPELISCSVSDPEDKLAAYFKTLQKPAGDWLTKDL